MDLKSCFDKAAKSLSSLFLPPPPPPAASASAGQPSPLRAINSTDENLKQLEATMRRIQALILDSEENRSSNMHTERLRLKELKDVAYDADDVLDVCAYHVLQARIEALDGNGACPSRKRKLEDDEQVFHSITSPTCVSVPKEIVEKAEKIMKEFDNINSQWDNLRLWDTDGNIESCIDKKNIEPTSSFFHQANVFGRMDDKEKVIEMLFTENIEELCPVSVLPIVGMAGIGKTMLAQLVYNDSRICSSFDLHGWVFVGGNFNVETLTKKIIAAFTSENCDLTELNELHKKLVEVVRGKKFFLVLDDVSNDTARAWESLLAPLARAQSGRIVVTAHDEQVAKIKQRKPFYSLNYLPFEDCWSIFKQLVFGGNNQDPRPELLEIGKSIVEKCNGLPLAVKAIGNTLLFESDEEKWNEVLTSDKWELDESKDGIPLAVKVSYDRMPIYLKQCFVFFSLFPKGYLFSKDRMIRLWMSLGLCEKNCEKEHFGGKCIGELLRCSMIQDGESMGFFSLHNVIHDLVRSVAGDDFMRMYDEMLNGMKGEIITLENEIYAKRYLSIINKFASSICLDALNESKKLRILQLVGSNDRIVDIRIPNELFQNLAHLRALDFSNAAIKTLPDSVGNLIQLRYLVLTNTGIQKLPETICSLYNLETLDLMECPIQELPQGIKNLVKLRHLYFEKSYFICMPRGMGRLKELRTLPRFDVGTGNWHCRLGELSELVNLRGELCIGGLDNAADVDDALKADLGNKNIDILRLDWSTGESRQCRHGFENPNNSASTHHHERVLARLRPNSTVKELHIYRYCGSLFPSWLGDTSFTNLEKISIVGGSADCNWLPSLGELLSLKTLSIQSLQGVQCVNTHFCFCSKTSNYCTQFCFCSKPSNSFRSLEYLEFFNMVHLMDWYEIPEFASLKTVKIIDCPLLLNLPSRLSSSLTKLVIKDCARLAKLPALPALKSLTLKGRLKIDTLSNLEFPSLTILKICHSSNIRSLCGDNWGLPLLEILVIHSCKNLQVVSGFSAFKTLKLFKICKCRNTEFYPDEEIPPSLKQLDISDCPMLNGWQLFHENNVIMQLNENDGVIDEELEALAELSEAGSEDGVIDEELEALAELSEAGSEISSEDGSDADDSQ